MNESYIESVSVKNQRGAISLLLILAITFGVGLAASAYLNYYQFQRAEQDRQLLERQVTDLRYQVNQNQLASASPSVSPTPTPLATPEGTPTPTPQVAGTASVSISQYGVKLTVSDPVADLTYDMVKNGIYTVSGLSTRALIAKYPACAPSASNNALGQIVQKKHGQKSTGVLIKQVGVYDYFYIAPSGYCAPDQAGRNELAAARAAVKNAALPTLTN